MRDAQDYIYRYETHCHTNRCSKCAVSTPADMAKAYYEKGYAGMVITDHFLLGNTAVDPTLPWEKKMREYYEAYLEAVNFSVGKDFHVLFGLEHAYGSGKEVLTYGIDLPFLLSHPDLHRYSLEEYCKVVKQAGGMIVMAHPYRYAPYIDETVGPKPEVLDGAEIFNFHNTGEANVKAARLAGVYKLIATSGGDVHSADSPAIGMAGVAFSQPIFSGSQFVQQLQSGNYRLIINGELV